MRVCTGEGSAGPQISSSHIQAGKLTPSDLKQTILEQFHNGKFMHIRPSQKIKKLSDQKYLLTTFIGSHETLKNGN